LLDLTLTVRGRSKRIAVGGGGWEGCRVSRAKFGDESRWRREVDGRFAGKRPVEATRKGYGRLAISFKLEGPEPPGGMAHKWEGFPGLCRA